MSMDTYLKCVLGFRGVFDISFLFIVKIWHDVQNGSGSTLSSIYFQKIAVSPDSSYLVGLCPNQWCNNPIETFFLGICFFYFGFSFLFTKNTCFICALYGNVTSFCLLSLNKTVQNPLWKIQLCPEFINAIIESNQSHKSGTNITLYNVAMKDFPFPSCISIWTCTFFFDVMKCTPTTSIYLSVYTNEPVIKYEIYGVMWQVSPESKIQLVGYKLSP